MSGERTEHPTARRLEEFRKEGRIAHSPELGGILTLFVGVYMLALVGPRLGDALARIMRASYAQVARQDATPFTYARLVNAMNESLIDVALSLAPWLATLMVAGVAVNLAQTRGLVQPRLLIPKWNRLNPLSRAKQMFGKQLLVETAKGLAKQTAIALVVYFTVVGQLGKLISTAQLGLSSGIGGLIDVSFSMSMQAAGILLAIAVLDYAWRFYQHRQSLRMTKQEVRDESNQQDGSPEVKSRIRRIQREMSQRRMMQQIPKADAIVVNPTHYAAAIRYDSKRMNAPILIAKGKDEVALRMIAIARRHFVPVVPNKPLARALYKLPLDTTIPPDLFQAVAGVLAFVYGLKKKKR